MRRTQRVAAHLLKLANAVILYCIRHRRTHAGVVLVIACAFQLYRFTV